MRQEKVTAVQAGRSWVCVMFCVYRSKAYHSCCVWENSAACGAAVGDADWELTEKLYIY